MQSGDDKYKKIFSKNLNYYMNLKEKTQTDLIIDLNINKSAISSWCNGTRLPRMNKIQLLADYFNINVSDLIENTREDNNYFEFICKDDAMFPLLDVGDIAIVHKRNTIKETEKKYKGTYLINLNNRKTIRKIILNEDTNTFQLTGLNIGCKPLNISKEDFYNKVQVLGIVIKAENISAFKI